jgi:hypothetical protein
MNEQLDAQGEAREALSTAVTSYGRRVLDDPRMLGNLVADLLPDLPRERSLLVTAAEADVAGDLERHVEQQRLDADTAVQLVARRLTDRQSIDSAASTWVVAEYATALGYQMRAAAQQLRRDDNRDYQETIPGPAPVPVPEPVPVPVPEPVPVPPTPKPKPRLAKLVGGTAAALVVYLVVAASAHLVPFGPGPRPTPTPTPPAPSPTLTSPAPSPTPTVLSLTQLLPADVSAASCHDSSPPSGLTIAGLVQAEYCTTSDLPGGYIYAYQVQNAADYQTTITNYNKWWGITSSAQSSCPPSGTGSSAQGVTGWHSTEFPEHSGQVLECEWVGSNGSPNEPAYTWTFPTENAFIVAQGAANSTFSALDSWWSNHAAPASS